MIWFAIIFAHKYNKINYTSCLSIIAKYGSSLLYRSARARIPSAGSRGTPSTMLRSLPCFFTAIVAE